MVVATGGPQGLVVLGETGNLIKDFVEKAKENPWFNQIIKDGAEACVDALSLEGGAARKSFIILENNPGLMQGEGSVAKAVETVGKGRLTYRPPSPQASTPVFRKGQQGNLLRTFQPKVIHGREYSGHAIQRMNERGLTPMAIENAIKNGVSFPNKEMGRVTYYDSLNKISVVTESNKVITVSRGKF